MDENKYRIEAIEVKITKLNIQKDEILVIQPRVRLLTEQWERIEKRLHDLLPDTKILLVDKEFELKVIKQE